MSLIGKLFGTGDNPADITKLDGTTEATFGRSLSALPQDGRGWVTFAEARTLFSAKSDQYAFGETDDDGRKRLATFVQLLAGRQLHIARALRGRSEGFRTLARTLQ